jgi:cobalt-zinc-cadmium efflux system outer membrane protein
VTLLLMAAASAGAQGTAAPTLTLRALFDSLRSGHPAVRAAEGRLTAAEGSRGTAGRLMNPMGFYGVEQAPFPGGTAPVGMDKETTLSATLPLESFYQRGPRVAQANAEVRAATADVAATKQRVYLDAALAFYRTALAQSDVATVRELSDWLDSLVAYNKMRVEEGVAAEVDLIRSEVERDRMRAEAGLREAELARARAHLAPFVASGTLPANMGVLADDRPMPLPDRATLSVAARPDIRMQTEMSAAAASAVSLEQWSLVRQLGFTFGAMRVAGTNSMVAGVAMPIPIFDQNRGEVQRASGHRLATEQELVQLKRVAAAELQGAWDAAAVLSTRAQDLTGNDSAGTLRRAEEARRVAVGAYREGAVSLYQVIDAARAWADTRDMYYRALYAQHESVLTLFVAAGMDLSTTQAAPPGGTR